MPCPFRDCANKILALPNSARLIFAAAAIALIFVFVMQYGFHHEPCVLCLWQRVPYGVVLVLAGLACLKPLYPLGRILLGLCALAFAIGAGVAFFHTGVELHWWLGTSGCSITPLSGTTPEDLRTQLLHTVVARCDEISWTFLGLSMANYNVAYSLVLAGYSFFAARRAAR